MSKRILFVNDEMVVGGVARVLNNLLRALVESTDYEIDLLILHKHGEMLSEIPQGINVIEGSPFFSVIDLPLSQLIRSGNVILLLRKLYLILLMKTGLIGRKVKKERKKMNLPAYDVEIAFKEGFCTIFVANGNSRKKVNWVHLDYKVQNYSSNYMPLLRKTLKLMDEQVAVSKVAAKSYEEVFLLEKPVTVIHNIIQQEMIKSKYQMPIQETRESIFNHQALTFISVGRLVDQKGYDRLINVHKRLIDEGLYHNIMVIGNGEDETMLNELIEKYELKDSFKLLGYRENPFPYFKLADAFLLPSRYEGLPTVVFESLLCRTPVIATKVAGIEEQLKNDEYGIVVENNEDAFYHGMKKMLEDTSCLNQMEKQLQHYQYHNDKIITQIKQMVEEKDVR